MMVEKLMWVTMAISGIFNRHDIHFDKELFAVSEKMVDLKFRNAFFSFGAEKSTVLGGKFDLSKLNLHPFSRAFSGPLTLIHKNC